MQSEKIFQVKDIWLHVLTCNCILKFSENIQKIFEGTIFYTYLYFRSCRKRNNEIVETLKCNLKKECQMPIKTGEINNFIF